MDTESSFFDTPGSVALPEGITAMRLLYESATGACCIYEARHLGRKVAIKALKPARKDDPVALMQIKKEFSLAFGIESGGVCRVLAAIDLPDGTPAIEMEYCAGSSLRQIIDRGEVLDDAAIDAIVEGLLAALADIHAAGVVHRDIKPANIIFDPVCRVVKIIDFGCADSAACTTLKGPAGTRRYTPGSKQTAGAEPAPPDDLYAAGITLLELASVAPRAKAVKLRSFGRRLCAGRYTSASAALSAYRAKGGVAAKVMAAAAAVAVVVAAALFIVRPHPPKPAAAPVTALEETAPVHSTRVSDDSLYRYAFFAGPMMARVARGEGSEKEKSDVRVIAFADSLYRADLMMSLVGHQLAKERIAAIADSCSAVHGAGLDSVMEATAGSSYDADFGHRLLRARLCSGISLYHSAD
ncbi:MAG: serine/threonine protein kinase [Muribaculaceae bacterium]|nr:serine/threonine protein kinase [Muribaculaceae bacterium]